MKKKIIITLILLLFLFLAFTFLLYSNGIHGSWKYVAIANSKQQMEFFEFKGLKSIKLNFYAKYESDKKPLVILYDDGVEFKRFYIDKYKYFEVKTFSILGKHITVEVNCSETVDLSCDVDTLVY